MLPVDFDTKTNEVGARLVLGNIKQNGNHKSIPDINNKNEYSYNQLR